MKCGGPPGKNSFLFQWEKTPGKTATLVSKQPTVMLWRKEEEKSGKAGKKKREEEGRGGGTSSLDALFVRLYK